MIRTGRRADERGLSESTQWALLVVVIVAGLLACIEGCAWLYGRSVSAAAAQAGAEAQTIYGAASGAAVHVAHQVAEAGGLEAVQVVAGSDGGTWTVRVTGQVASFIGWRDLTVTAVAHRPTETP